MQYKWCRLNDTLLFYKLNYLIYVLYELKVKRPCREYKISNQYCKYIAIALNSGNLKWLLIFNFAGISSTGYYVAFIKFPPILAPTYFSRQNWKTPYTVPLKRYTFAQYKDWVYTRLRSRARWAGKVRERRTHKFLYDK